MPGSSKSIHVNAREKRLEEVKSAVRNKPDSVNSRDSRGRTPLHWAAQYGSTEIVEFLITAGADIDSKTRQRYTALILAAENGHTGVVKHLLSKGADVHACSGGKAYTALHKSATLKNPEILYELLDRGADPSALDGDGNTPCRLAIKKGNSRNAKILMEFDAQLKQEKGDMSGQGPTKETPSEMIHQATREGDVSRVNSLLIEDPDLLHATDDSGWNPLHRAAKEGHTNLVKLLLQKGAEVDCRTLKHQWTPLLLSVERNHQDTVGLLLKSGADRGLSSRGKRETAMTLAMKTGNADVLRMLLPPCDPFRDKEKFGETSSTSHTTRTFDGKLGSASNFSYQPQRPKFFSALVQTWHDHFELKDRDKKVKVAILDTGFDQTRANFEIYGIERKQGHFERIKSTKNFATIHQDANNVKDLDGHGTLVADIILGLAPTAEIYIARVCDGRVEGQTQEGDKTSDVPPENVEKAIQWAIEKEVDIINMSLGFIDAPSRVEDALLEAKKHKILTFAAMNNEGNYDMAAWPARDPDLAIGIHSCDSMGKRASDFTPGFIENSPNFTVVGEKIILYSPVEKAFEEKQGTSFSTPIAVSIAALILSFTKQSLCAPYRQILLEAQLNISNLGNIRVMSRLLKRVSSPIGDYTSLSPYLFWKPPRIYNKDMNKMHAWNEICQALEK